jgi:hypothetical protein
MEQKKFQILLIWQNQFIADFAKKKDFIFKRSEAVARISFCKLAEPVRKHTPGLGFII